MSIYKIIKYPIDGGAFFIAPKVLSFQTHEISVTAESISTVTNKKMALRETQWQSGCAH